MECCRLRIKDIDFSRNEVVVRSGKGDKDRYTMLPSAVRDSLIQHLEVSNPSTTRILRTGWAGFHCPMLSIENIQMPAKNGDGSGFFPRPAITPTDRQEKSAGIISMNRFYNERSKKRG